MIFCLTGEAWTQKNSLIPSLFIEELVPNKESERPFICELKILILPLFPIFQLDF
jgi:hypothetical protein